MTSNNSLQAGDYRTILRLRLQQLMLSRIHGSLTNEQQDQFLHRVAISLPPEVFLTRIELQHEGSRFILRHRNTGIVIEVIELRLHEFSDR